MSEAPIGVFDSGIGGLSILGAIHDQNPNEELLYLADQVHLPYGQRPLEEIRSLSIGITRFLLAQGAKLIVVACNTASAAALHNLRARFPHIPFVGVEPAVKPAARVTRSGRIAVLATPVTFQGQLFASTVNQHAEGVEVLRQPLPGLVEQIEAGRLDNPKTRALLEAPLGELRARGVDTVVLGCTHYPFLIPLMREILGPEVEIIHPAPAVARQAGRLLSEHALASSRNSEGGVVFYSTGDANRLVRAAEAFVQLSGAGVDLQWKGGDLTARPKGPR
jgi:glutamate racemase